MIEATYKLTEDDWIEVRNFEDKIKLEFERFCNGFKKLNAEEMKARLKRFEFMCKMTDYFLADNFSLSKIRELTYEYKLLENCYKQYIMYKRKYGKKAISMRVYVRMVMEDEKY